MMSAPAAVLQRTFLIEFMDHTSWDSSTLTSCLSTTKAAGIRTVAMSRSSPVTATVADQLRIFREGFDVVYTYNLDNAITARKLTNTQRGISPP